MKPGQVEMPAKLKKMMRERLGKTVEDLDRMTESELKEFYEKAVDLEVELALKACDETERGESIESIRAAHIVDYIHDFYMTD